MNFLLFLNRYYLHTFILTGIKIFNNQINFNTILTIRIKINSSIALAILVLPVLLVLQVLLVLCNIASIITSISRLLPELLVLLVFLVLLEILELLVHITSILQY